MSRNLLSQTNHLFALARLGRLRWPSWARQFYTTAALFFAVLTPFVAQFIIIVPVLVLLAISAEWSALGALIPDFNPDADMSLKLVLSFLPIYFLVWAWLWLCERRHLWTIGMEWTGWWRAYVRGLLVGLLMFSGAVGIMALWGYVVVDSAQIGQPGVAQPATTLQNSLFVVGGALIVFAGWIVQGAAEEVLTRGFLLQVVGTRWGALAGILLSSLIFALFHLFNPNLSLIALLNLFLFGVFTALYALSEGGLWGVFAIHTMWNWAQGNVYGFPVSGQEFDSTTFWNLAEVGPDWLTGGSFGPEGGVIVTVVLVAGSLVVWVVHVRAGAAQPDSPSDKMQR